MRWKNSSVNRQRRLIFFNILVHADTCPAKSWVDDEHPVIALERPLPESGVRDGDERLNMFLRMQSDAFCLRDRYSG